MEDFKLRIFLVLCRTGSFTAAASELGISQPAVSQNIRELEGVLGTLLFVRSHGRLEITPAGRIFRHYASMVIDAYSSLSAAFIPSSGEEDRLSIYFPPVSRAMLSGDVISVLGILRPRLDISIADDIGTADINIIEMQDKKRKDTGIVIDLHVFPKNHPMSRLVMQAIDIVRYGDVLSD
ncbi:MAG: LysR family transcriptional regulator [Clostridium sp.]|nr:LysR family transcriptional regulator [Bacteroides sp.]MCM1199270.1 LysR family transcriptional regulator [Clostridium sp.]